MRRWIETHTLLVTVLLVVGLGVSIEVLSVVIQPLGEDPPLLLSVRLEQREFKQNETIRIEVILKNLGNDTIILHFSTSAIMWFRIFNSSGNLIYTEELHSGALLMQTRLILSSGEHYNVTFHWRQDMDNGDPIVRGLYMVQGYTSRFSFKKQFYRYNSTLLLFNIYPEQNNLLYH